MQELYSQKDGEGADLIIMHGLFGNAKNWQSLAKIWAKNFKVHRPNARNHAFSFKSSHMDYQLMAQDLAIYMKNNSIEKSNIIGHSMGGKTSMKFASLYPQMVDKLIIVDISTGAYPPKHNKVLQSLEILNSKGWNSRKDALEALQKIKLEKATKDFLLSDLGRDKNKDNKLFLQMSLENIKANYEILIDGIEIDAIEAKTLLLAGKKSDYINAENLAKMQDKFLNFEYKFLDGGHWLHNDAMADVSQEIQNFISS